MPFLKEFNYPGGTNIYVWSLTETVEDLRHLCIRRGISVEKERPVRSIQRRCERLAELLLLHIIYGKPVELAHTPDGAPVVVDESAYHISISHTCGTVCIATNSNQPIGVDVERKGTRVLKVRDHFLSEIERRWLSDSDANANTIAWTAKEALYKIAGIRGIDLSDELQLEPFQCVEHGIINFHGQLIQKDTIQNFDISSMVTYDTIMTLAESSKKKPGIY